MLGWVGWGVEATSGRAVESAASEELVVEGDTLDLVGKIIDDKYAIERLVGEGGFALVYRANHLLWKRPVAVKVFKALTNFAEKDREKLLEEFIQEGSLLADLSARTAAIVQARDVGMLTTPKGERVPYMVLEWLEGVTLEDVLLAERAMTPRTLDEIVHLLDPVAEALGLAHRQGIAHRDVKPGNIFVLGNPRGAATVKLLDFGIAKVVSDAQRMAGSFTKTGGQITSFTPAYGAPEQFSRTHGATGPWTDVFALALVVVEAMTGTEPLGGDDVVQLAVASANPDRRPTPRGRGAAVSDAVEGVFLKAVAVRPADRWQTTGEFWNALRSALHMAPLRGMTTPVLVAESARAPLSSAPTVAAAPPIAATAPFAGRDLASTTARQPGAGKMGVFVALGVGAVVAVAAAVFFVGSKKPAPAAITTAEVHPALVASNSAAAVAVAHPAPACPKGMLPIPGGSFFMGSDDGGGREKPAHQVTLSPFCIDEFEVTVDRYVSCSDRGRCKRAGSVNEWGDEKISESDRRAYDPLCNVRDPAGRAQHPINCVDWEMAEKFCHEDGGRLPTEAEWEFAARGPDGRKYPWGDEDPASNRLNACGKECMVWGSKNGVTEKAMYDVDDGFPNTAPVGSFPNGKSRYGVQDVVGNVWEWVSDYYGPYAKDEEHDPKGPAEGEERVIRGGAWNGSYASWVRPTFRHKDTPGKRSYGIGFRCAK